VCVVCVCVCGVCVCVCVCVSDWGWRVWSHKNKTWAWLGTARSKVGAGFHTGGLGCYQVNQSINVQL